MTTSAEITTAKNNMTAFNNANMVVGYPSTENAKRAQSGFANGWTVSCGAWVSPGFTSTVSSSREGTR